MPTFSAPFLRDYVAARLGENGVNQATAEQVAENLVEACLKGHDSHGVSMLPRYLEAIAEGGLNPAASAELLQDNGALLAFDGQHGFGQVVGRQAAAAGIARAAQLGVAVVGLANAHHLGRIGAFAEQAAQAGLVSLHFANVNSRAIVMPWQGQYSRLGTNPFCAGIPQAAGAPVILDFATSAIAGNKARIAWNAGKQVEPGCIVDDAGQPTQDPRWVVQPPLGALLPFGKHKGSGLALVCSLLGAALTGGITERHVASGKKRIINSMLSIYIDPDRLGGAESWRQEVPALLAWVRSSRDDGELLLPGDAERNAYQHRLQHGIEVDEVSWQQLQALAPAL
ncbi:malate/lactate/ureidoglycolate dehydrogenase [Gibbsiella quercinecans]|uniref:malate/lactate/ureidoglycolate dehydrogenase n=1 Tax=Gibbsiella quercinecans TaxID=929813 RepID=UPI000EF16CF1|nr:malate/lactate/ureidoglycolate dehydrogenase [Gibbsiella quercinecans]RLM13210.1 dehydrogenase [Gibbsiella quercinecans]